MSKRICKRLVPGDFRSSQDQTVCSQGSGHDLHPATCAFEGIIKSGRLCLWGKDPPEHGKKTAKNNPFRVEQIDYTAKGDSQPPPLFTDNLSHRVISGVHQCVLQSIIIRVQKTEGGRQVFSS